MKIIKDFLNEQIYVWEVLGSLVATSLSIYFIPMILDKIFKNKSK